MREAGVGASRDGSGTGEGLCSIPQHPAPSRSHQWMPAGRVGGRAGGEELLLVSSEESETSAPAVCL